MLRARGLKVDVDAFNTAMERAREEARRSWAGSGEAGTEKVWFGLREKVGATEFLGYDADMAEGKVVAIVVDGKEVQEASAGTAASVIVNQTPFYGDEFLLKRGLQILGDALLVVGVRLHVCENRPHFFQQGGVNLLDGIGQVGGA